MRRFLSFLLVVLITFFGISSLKSNVHALGWLGSGTVEDPYIITSPQQLQNMNTELDAHFKLGSNIDMTGFYWTSIGSFDDPFVGELDGDDYEISNLELKAYTSILWDDMTATMSGMFGVVGSGASLHHFGLQYTLLDDDMNLGANNTYLGGVAAIILGNYDIQVSHIRINGNVDITTIESNEYLSVGGLAGDVYRVNDIHAISFTGTIKADAFYYEADLGGIVGYGENTKIHDCTTAYSTITLQDNDYPSGVGGIVGYLSYDDFVFSSVSVFFRNFVDNSVITIKGAETNGGAAGGLVGHVANDIGNDVKFIENIVDSTTIKSGAIAGGMVGHSNHGFYESNQVKNSNVFSTEDQEITDNESQIGFGGIIGYSSFDRIQDVAVTDVYIIDGPIVNNVGGIVGYADNDEIYRFIVDASIMSSGYGAGGVGGSLVNTIISDGDVTTDIDGYMYVGGIAGALYGNTEIQKASFNGSLSGDSYLGGIFGYGGIESSIHLSDVFSRGDYEANYTLGGLIGYAEENPSSVEMINAYFAGKLSIIEGVDVDPITYYTMYLDTTNVFYDSELYTKGSVIENSGVITQDLKDPQGTIGEIIGVDDSFERNNTWFVYDDLNDGYFTLWGDAHYLIYVDRGSIVRWERSYGEIQFNESEFDPEIEITPTWVYEDPAYKIEREAYIFQGWSDDLDESPSYTGTSPIQYEELVLFAQWSDELPNTGEPGNYAYGLIGLGCIGLMIVRKRSH